MAHESPLRVYSRREILRRGAAYGLLVAGSGGILAACGATASSVAPTQATPDTTSAPAASAPMGTLAKARADGTIRVGFANEAPYAYASADGKLVGIMPDVIGYLMAQLGVAAVEGVLTEFGGLIPGLQAGRFDLLGAGLYVRPARCEQVAPSNPQYTVGEGMMVLKGNPKNLKSYPDVANTDAKIGTLTGSVNVEYLQIANVPADRVVLFPDLPSAVAGLQAARVDAVTMSSVSLQDVLTKANDPNLELVSGFVDPLDKDGNATRGFGSAWFRKEDLDLLEGYNAELAKILDSGKLLELMAPYGFTADQVPAKSVTAAQLCGQS